MAYFRITSDFAYMRDGELLVKATTIHTAMLAAIGYFATPDPTMASVKEVKDAYELALAGAKTRDKTKIALKNEMKEDLIQILRALGLYVSKTAEGEEAPLVASGFTLFKPSQPSSPITTPEDFKVENGINPGEIITSVKAVKGAKAYIHQYTADPLTETSQWINVTTTNRKNLFTGLQAAKTYWFRVIAVGIKDQVAYSEIQSKIAQ